MKNAILIIVLGSLVCNSAYAATFKSAQRVITKTKEGDNKTYVKITFCQYKTSPSGWILWHKPFTFQFFLIKKNKRIGWNHFKK